MAESQKASNFEEIFQQFSAGLKDLKCLREQLYAAAEHFESSFDRENHKQELVETSKDYVAKALVNTVDHLGSAADKLNKFFDQKADEFSDTSLRFSCIQQRLNTFQGFLDFTAVSKQSGMAVEAPKHHKKYTLPAESFRLGKSVSLYSNCISSPQHGMHRSKQNTLISTAFQATARKQNPASSSRTGNSRVASSEVSPQLNFSFARVVPKKETGKRSASPLHFPLMRFGSVANRSISPSPHESRKWIPSESRRAISVSRRPETTGREADIESYTKKGKNMFKAFLTMHQLKREP